MELIQAVAHLSEEEEEKEKEEEKKKKKKDMMMMMKSFYNNIILLISTFMAVSLIVCLFVVVVVVVVVVDSILCSFASLRRERLTHLYRKAGGSKCLRMVDNTANCHAVSSPYKNENL